MSQDTTTFFSKIAKRRKLCKDVETHLNSYLLKPRDFYNLIHGKKERHLAYELCLFMIDDMGSNADGSPRGIDYDFAGQYARMKRVGVQFPCSMDLISKKYEVIFVIGTMNLNSSHHA